MLRGFLKNPLTGSFAQNLVIFLKTLYNNKVMPATTETKIQIPYPALLLLALTFLIIVRLLPMLKAPLGNYGYDYGFYLYAINHLSPLLPQTWLTALWGGYNNPLFYLATLLHISGSIMLNELYLALSVLLGVSLYVFFRLERKIAVFAVLLLACSVIQTEGYTMYLWKNLAALPFLILAFTFLGERKWWPVILNSLMIFLTHRTTAIIYCLTLAVYAIAELIRHKKYNWLIVLACCGLAVPVGLFNFSRLRPTIEDLITNHNSYVSSGLFLPGQNLLPLLWPFLLLALPGLYVYTKRRGLDVINIFTVICLLWYIFQLPFYRRFLIYLDLSMIIYAAYFLGQISYTTTIKKIALAIVLVFLGYQSVGYVLAKQPLIYQNEVVEIQNFRTNPPGQFVLAVTANDAPWLLGFGQNIRLAAPGLFEDRFTYQEWENFWQGQNQRELLWKYPRPLYIYQRSYRLQGPITQCLKPVSENFYQYTCN